MSPAPRLDISPFSGPLMRSMIDLVQLKCVVPGSLQLSAVQRPQETATIRMTSSVLQDNAVRLTESVGALMNYYLRLLHLLQALLL